MKKTKIQIGLGIALFLVMLGIIIVAVVSDSGKNYIENYVASIDVDESGGIIVEETVVVNYKQYMNYIQRNVKYNKVLTSGEPYKNYPSNVFSNSKANFNTNDVEIRAYRGNLLDENDIVTNITNDVAIVRSWDANPYYYTESGARELTDGYLERVMCIDILKNSSDAYNIPEEKRLYGYMTFVYRYQIESMVNTYNDCAELNYVVFNETDMKIKNAKVTVTLPKQVSDINELRGYGHGLSNGLIEIAAPQSVVYTAKNITLEEDFEIRVLFPTGIVTETATNHVDIEIKDRIINLEKISSVC